jgi:hypothetical protein
MNIFLKSVVALCLSAAIAAAAIPRKTELRLQQESPEQVEIHVVTMEKKRRGAEFDIVATAKVTKVGKSASGLTAGTELTIKYSVPSTPIPGAPPSVVKKGQRCSAFLRKAKDGDHYEPAAASGTFDPPVDE